jgi:hypothetical protein
MSTPRLREMSKSFKKRMAMETYQQELGVQCCALIITSVLFFPLLFLVFLPNYNEVYPKEQCVIQTEDIRSHYCCSIAACSYICYGFAQYSDCSSMESNKENEVFKEGYVPASQSCNQYDPWGYCCQRSCHTYQSSDGSSHTSCTCVYSTHLEQCQVQCRACYDYTIGIRFQNITDSFTKRFYDYDVSKYTVGATMTCYPHKTTLHLTQFDRTTPIVCSVIFGFVPFAIVVTWMMFSFMTVYCVYATNQDSNRKFMQQTSSFRYIRNTLRPDNIPMANVVEDDDDETIAKASAPPPPMATEITNI